MGPLTYLYLLWVVKISFRRAQTQVQARQSNYRWHHQSARSATNKIVNPSWKVRAVIHWFLMLLTSIRPKFFWSFDSWLFTYLSASSWASKIKNCRHIEPSGHRSFHHSCLVKNWTKMQNILKLFEQFLIFLIDIKKNFFIYKLNYENILWIFKLKFLSTVTWMVGQLFYYNPIYRPFFKTLMTNQLLN